MAPSEQDQGASITQGQTRIPDGVRDLQVTHRHERSLWWMSMLCLTFDLAEQEKV